jgi:hypothetical protein
MKKIHMMFGVVAFALFFSCAAETNAYFTTNQTAIRIDDQHALFAITYKFGSDTEDMYLPALATQDKSGTSSNFDTLTYSFYENGDQVQTTGNSLGIIVSKASFVDGMYKVEKGTAQSFTLVTLLTTEKSTFEEDYALQVTSLPFTLGTLSQKLNPTELQYYVTKEVELNTGNYPQKAIITNIEASQ